MKLSSIMSVILAFFMVISSGRVFGASAKADDSENLIIYSCKNDSNKIALTFDDGPHPRQTRVILDILDEYGIKATFFAVGINVENYGSALEEVAERGHEIANHTYTHSRVSGLDYESFKKEILDSEEKIFEKTEYFCSQALFCFL